MRKNITKKQLQRLVEQRVDEAWYNNLDDFYHGVGKVATYGAIGAATLGGCATALDKGLEQQERYEQSLNQQAAKNMHGSDYHFEKWCEEHDLDPNTQKAQQFYDDWVEDQMNESRIRMMVESRVRENLMENFGLYTNDIDTDDVRVSYVSPFNDDGYCEWEATCSNGWYSFRGTFDGNELILDDVIEGHSGHGRQVNIDNEVMDWFEENLYDEIRDQVEAQADDTFYDLGDEEDDEEEFEIEPF